MCFNLDSIPQLIFIFILYVILFAFDLLYFIIFLNDKYIPLWVKIINITKILFFIYEFIRSFILIYICIKNIKNKNENDTFYQKYKVIMDKYVLINSIILSIFTLIINLANIKYGIESIINELKGEIIIILVFGSIEFIVWGYITIYWGLLRKIKIRIMVHDSSIKSKNKKLKIEPIKGNDFQICIHNKKIDNRLNFRKVQFLLCQVEN